MHGKASQITLLICVLNPGVNITALIKDLTPLRPELMHIYASVKWVIIDLENDLALGHYLSQIRMIISTSNT